MLKSTEESIVPKLSTSDDVENEWDRSVNDFSAPLFKETTSVQFNPIILPLTFCSIITSGELFFSDHFLFACIHEVPWLTTKEILNEIFS